MDVKHNHLCMFTGKTTTCFVFKNFSVLLSLSRPAYEQLVENYPLYIEEDGRCMFCENHKPVKKITGFDDNTFFTDVFMCQDCFDKVQSYIEDDE